MEEGLSRPRALSRVARRAAAGGGPVHARDRQKGGLLGLGTGGWFETGHVQLASGDTLLLCTDGVVEAEDAVGGFYGDVRAIACLASLAGKSAEAIVQGMRSDVRAFAGDAPKSDDITLLALGFRSP